MKKISVSVFCVFAFVVAQAQHPINSFFAPDGTVRLETQELSEAADSVVTIQHRTEDVVWRRDIYRVIDMRQKQNFQLYFPREYNDPTYKSLIRVIVDAVLDNRTVFRPGFSVFKPNLDVSNILPRNEIKDRFMVGNANEYDRNEDNSFLVLYDSITDQLSFNDFNYEQFIRNQVKFALYEVIFFDKSTSRLYRKIVAIAPLKSDIATSGAEPSQFMRESVMFWMLYDQLRPYLASHYMIPSQNEAKRVTFEEFFEKRLFSSYIVGEGNIYNRMILDYCFTEKDAKQEQERIEYELLTFEQDLWEY